MVEQKAIADALIALKESTDAVCKLLENATDAKETASSQWASQAAHTEAIAEAIEVLDQCLVRLTTPEDYLHRHVVQFQRLSCLYWACQFGILQHVPLHGQVGIRDVAGKASVPERLLRSVIAMLTTDGFFEVTAGEEYVRQSPRSRVFAEHEFLRDWLIFMVGYSQPTAMRMAEATKRWKSPVAKHETAYSLAMGTHLSFFDHLSQDPAELKCFKNYMSSIAQSDALSTRHVLHAVDWTSTPIGSTVVDIGGSSGHVSRTLATTYPNLRMVVQDLPEVVAAQPRGQVCNNVSFLAHDFFKPQPIHSATVYLLRTILHDWPDADAMAILNHIAMAMGPASRIVILDIVLPESGTVLKWQEAKLRSRDLTMMQTFNSLERSASEWRSLIARLDRRMDMKIHHLVGGGTLSSVELCLAQG